jgi:hypothetical protein
MPAAFRGGSRQLVAMLSIPQCKASIHPKVAFDVPERELGPHDAMPMRRGGD